jgi:drug/metabolite transporter (DMT)-like permease
MLSALLALASGAVWGTADFLGGTLSRRLPVVTVLAASQGLALGLLLVVVPASGGLHEPGPYLLWGAGTGVVGLTALAAFYRALADGTMGVVAPIAATGVIIPVVVGLAGGDAPSSWQIAGIVLAVVGIVLASVGEVTRGSANAPRSIALAIVAAIGFGAALVFIERGSQVSVGMTLIMTRLAGAVFTVPMAIALARQRMVGNWRADWKLLAALGVADVGANALFGIASRGQDLSLVGVLASLYPVYTVLLARHLHGELLTRVQAAGVTTAFVGVALIAAM